mmetsp:Transcript_21253/g.56237  ORF Transcript_21253/g.56237 Transcript_21253/m.56237 type:complete len:253 (-) Transcript_21253:17-775(-)
MFVIVADPLARSGPRLRFRLRLCPLIGVAPTDRCACTVHLAAWRNLGSRPQLTIGKHGRSFSHGHGTEGQTLAFVEMPERKGSVTECDLVFDDKPVVILNAIAEDQHTFADCRAERSVPQVLHACTIEAGLPHGADRIPNWRCHKGEVAPANPRIHREVLRRICFLPTADYCPFRHNHEKWHPEQHEGQEETDDSQAWMTCPNLECEESGAAQFVPEVHVECHGCQQNGELQHTWHQVGQVRTRGFKHAFFN